MTVSLQGTEVQVVRSQSAFGFSMIYAVFEDSASICASRGPACSTDEPGGEGSASRRGADAGLTPRAWVTFSGDTLESPTLSLRDLRSLQDWFVRYQLNAVRGG